MRQIKERHSLTNGDAKCIVGLEDSHVLQLTGFCRKQALWCRSFLMVSEVSYRIGIEIMEGLASVGLHGSLQVREPESRSTCGL